MLGTGQQHWSTVHVADLAEAAAVAAGVPGAIPGSDGEARARLGDYFAEVLLLDQCTDAAKARSGLGWHPSTKGTPVGMEWAGERRNR